MKTMISFMCRLIFILLSALYITNNIRFLPALHPYELFIGVGVFIAYSISLRKAALSQSSFFWRIYSPINEYLSIIIILLLSIVILIWAVFRWKDDPYKDNGWGAANDLHYVTTQGKYHFYRQYGRDWFSGSDLVVYKTIPFLPLSCFLINLQGIGTAVMSPDDIKVSNDTLIIHEEMRYKLK